MISKEEFLKVMYQVQRTIEYQDDFHMINRKYECECIIDYPDCVCETLHLLNLLMGLEEHKHYGSDIDYFVFELNFGKNYEPGRVKDADENKIDFSSADKLYDYLVGGKNGGN